MQKYPPDYNDRILEQIHKLETRKRELSQEIEAIKWELKPLKEKARKLGPLLGTHYRSDIKEFVTKDQNQSFHYIVSKISEPHYKFNREDFKFPPHPYEYS